MIRRKFYRTTLESTAENSGGKGIEKEDLLIDCGLKLG